MLSLWRNRLARSAVNRKVGGSNPPGGDNLFLNEALKALFEGDILTSLVSIEIMIRVGFY